MYAPTSTQQPAAICALKSPADAIHVLEAVRVGLVPRVTRRLTGHERSQIRPGTVWVWEEEETNMRRWTDGRKWGASRVGGGGFLVYTEINEHHSPPVNQPDAAYPYPSFYPNPPREALVKQTYSTSMTHPVSGKVKKFHVVGYSSRSNPQGDAHSPLPLPHELPLLSTLQVVPGIWPEWERRREGTGQREGTAGTAAPESRANSGEASSARRPSAKSELPSPPQSALPSPQVSMPGLATATQTQPARGNGYADQSHPSDSRDGLSGAYNSPFYYAPANNGRSAPSYPVNVPAQHNGYDRYHPYRDRPGQHNSGFSSPGLPTPSSSTEQSQGDERRASGSAPQSLAPQQGQGQGQYAYPLPSMGSHAPYGGAYREQQPMRSPYTSQLMPPVHNAPSPYIDTINPYQNPYHQQQSQHHQQSHQPPPEQPRQQPARSLSHSPTVQTQTVPGQTDRSPKISISSALASENANSGGFTLPPLRVAIDGQNTRISPSGQSQRSSPGKSPVQDRRELGDSGKKVPL